MRLDTGFNVLTLPFEVNTLTIGPSSQELATECHDFRFLCCDPKI